MIDPETLYFDFKQIQPEEEVSSNEKSDMILVHEGNKSNDFSSIHEEKKVFKSKMEEEILNLIKEMDNMKAENSRIDLDQKRLLKVRQLVQKYETVTQRKYFEVICASFALIYSRQKLMISFLFDFLL
jgi:hypothetical protein